ncbi:RDD family protein [Ferrimonas sp. YFM]|uniref:RDD family protein n=1 Tax=Ferrimonas sp. YFM TaxID=3028878 RepID=UPI0025724A61|nr:RDD family protein [Ferrimonas sp. YFM]BDY04709.1 RDD domain protein [Ferrimonas sp. YFM]
MSQHADPRTIITPYAFNIAPKLLNRPLASPWRRGLAIAIDLLMVAILAELPGDLLLAIVLAVGWIRLRGYRIKGKLQTGIFIGFGLWLLFAMINATIQGWPEDTPSVAEPRVEVEQSVELDGICAEGDVGCVLRVIGDVTAKVVGEEFTTEQQMSDYLMERYGLTEAQAQQVAADIMSGDDEPADTPARETSSPEVAVDDATQTLEHAPPQTDEVVDALGTALEKQAEAEDFEADQEPERFSIIGVVKGIIEDLGLGLGWASVYFTVFTAWFHGQTLGKKLLAIRVIQLDNTPLSLWEAFGRYGGYGAGLTTGLMGFLQIFWDPNRQGIHDKISSTVVVDLRAKARKRARAERNKIMANQKELNE